MSGDGHRNILRGGEGDDTLDGRGGDDFIMSGLGDEVMTGGAGRDFFLFTTKPGADNFDTVTDFHAGTDRLMFAEDVFAVDGAGSTNRFHDMHYQHLRTNQFQSGEGHVAEDADIRIIYDSSNGILYYDHNGSGSGGIRKIADIGEGMDISADSIFVYAV